jgi:competence protein ComEC
MQKMGEYFKNIFRDSYFPFRLFTFFTLSFLAGIIIANLFKIDVDKSGLIFIISTADFILLAAINSFWRIKYLWLIAITCIFMLAGIFYQSFFDSKISKNVGESREVKITGEIVNRPQIDYKSQKFIIHINQFKESSNSHLAGTNAAVSAPIFPEFYYGDRVQIDGTISKPENFSDFDYQNYLKTKYVVAVIKPKKVIFLNHTENIAKKLINSLYQVESYFEEKLNRALPEPHSSLAAGILLGVKKNIPDDLMQAFQLTGLTHILALSGYNITIIVAVFAESVMAYIGRKRTFFVGLMLVLAFVIMSGGSISVVRAAIFSFLILFARLIGRQPDQTNLMLLIALVLVLINSYILMYDAGFQLSFLAFAGLIYISPVIKEYFEKKKLPNFIGLTLSETLGAQIAVLPILFFNFKTLSIISPLANLLVLWSLPYIMLLSFITIIVSTISPVLAKLIIVLLWPLLQYVIIMTEFLAKIPLGAFKF